MEGAYRSIYISGCVLSVPKFYELSLEWIGFGVNHSCMLKVNLLAQVLGMLCECTALSVKVPDIILMLEKPLWKILHSAYMAARTVDQHRVFGGQCQANVSLVPLTYRPRCGLFCWPG